ncbi:MAG TPA: hypothetical protein VKA95_05335 [Nitrososphaeraceae archaeon]|nr:hypothetical protein [Nitrososphaeraceae archaeon]
MANDLAKYGVVPRKWFIVKIKGGIENNRDLWRGVVDGDGNMGIYHRKTSTGSTRTVPYISLTGNLHVCLQFKAFLENTLSLPMPNLVPTKNSYLFSVSDHRAVRAIKLLYKECTVALDRKLAIAENIMNSFEVTNSIRYIKRQVLLIRFSYNQM